MLNTIRRIRILTGERTAKHSRVLLILFPILLLTSLAFGQSAVVSESGSTGFAKIWTVPRSPFAQSLQFATSVTQLPNGTLVAAGGDGYQNNGCPPNRGGAWLIGLEPNGANAWQRLYSTCATAGQAATVIRPTSDGGLILGGDDDTVTGCVLGCAFVAKLSNTGAITWQYDLSNAILATVLDIRETSDGGYIAVGNSIPINSKTDTLNALIVKLSPTGVPQWKFDFVETAASFPNAFSSAGITFGSVLETSDGGYIVSGIGAAQFASGFASVLMVLKLDSNGASQWQRVYYGNKWGSGAGGDSSYRVFQTTDGYVVTGAVQTITTPFGSLFLLMKLDRNGNVVWQNGFGSVSSAFNVNKGVSAAATSDGYILAGISNAFLSGPLTVYTGWMVKTDISGNIQWQNAYTGTTPRAQQFNDVIQTADGGYAAAGYSYVGTGAYGGPGFFLVKTDQNGQISGCACVHPTDSIPEVLDLAAFNANLPRLTDRTLSFTPISLIAKPTFVRPINIH